MSANKTTKVAIAIPVFNRREITLQGLRSLKRVDLAGIDLRIFVTDDASPDGTSSAIETEFPDVEVIEGDGTLHYAAGTNRAIEAAMKWAPDYIAIMNDDAVFHRNFLKSLVDTAKQFPDSVIGSLLLLWNEPHRVFQIDPKWSTTEGGWLFRDDRSSSSFGHTPFEVDAMVGNCSLIPADAIRRSGLLDEARFPHGWGDAQYFETLRRDGWKLRVDPNSLVWCEPNTNPMPLHGKGMAEQLRVLLFDTRHPVNVRRQFIARWHSAPSKPKAAAAFLFYLMRMSTKAARYRVS